jgi:predicted nucleic acid-binding protein
MTKVLNISNYQPKSSDVFFFDNNVWMYLFCPLANAKKEQQKKYSDFYKMVNIVSACVWINSLVLSEFCNAWLRIEFKNWKAKNKTFNADFKKDFVKSKSYLETIEEIKVALNKIRNNTEKTNDEFNSINFSNILTELENCDFNDSYYLEQARQKNWKIVTHDSDFFKNNKLKVEIITANI